jgi:signal peptidase I
VAALVALAAVVFALWPRRRTGRSVDALESPAPQAAAVPAVAPQPAARVVTVPAVEHPPHHPIPLHRRQDDGIDAPSAATANTAAARAVRYQLQRSRTARRRETSRQIRLVLAWVLAAVVVVVGFFTFRPQSIGGSVAYVSVKGISMTPTLHDGDLVVVRKHATYHPGDIVSFRVPAGQPDAGLVVIHRIVGGTATGYVTKGDHNPVPDPWHPTKADIVGSGWFSVPHLAAWIAWLRWVALGVVVLCVIALVLSFRPRRGNRAVKAEPPLPVDERPRPVLGAEAPGPRRAVSHESPIPDTAVAVMAESAHESSPEPGPVPVSAPEPAVTTPWVTAPAAKPVREPAPMPLGANEPAEMPREPGEVAPAEPAPVSLPEPAQDATTAAQESEPAVAEPVSWAVATSHPGVSSDTEDASTTESNLPATVRSVSQTVTTPDDEAHPVASLVDAVPERKPVLRANGQPQDSYWDRTRNGLDQRVEASEHTKDKRRRRKLRPSRTVQG